MFALARYQTSSRHQYQCLPPFFATGIVILIFLGVVDIQALVAAQFVLAFLQFSIVYSAEIASCPACVPWQLLDSDRFAAVLVAYPIPFLLVSADGGDVAAAVVAVELQSVLPDPFLAPFRVYSVPASDSVVPFPFP